MRSELKKLKDCFNCLDADGGGTIGLEELGKCSIFTFLALYIPLFRIRYRNTFFHVLLNSKFLLKYFIKLEIYTFSQN